MGNIYNYLTAKQSLGSLGVIAITLSRINTESITTRVVIAVVYRQGKLLYTPCFIRPLTCPAVYATAHGPSRAQHSLNSSWASSAAASSSRFSSLTPPFSWLRSEGYLHETLGQLARFS